jgi:hypothetical protein
MPDQGNRRTVVIRGQVADRYSPRRTPEQRARAASRARRQASRARPDRIAMWAVLLGIVLLVAAATSSHAATPHAATPPAPSMHIRSAAHAAHTAVAAPPLAAR